MLPGRMVAIAAHPFCFQDSGQLWEWVSCSGFCGDISGDGPLAWSDRGRSNRTDTVCSNPGWPCQLRYAAAACLPTACSGPEDHPHAPASLPATSHGLPATWATTWDPTTRDGRWGPDQMNPYPTSNPTDQIATGPPSPSLRGPHAVRGWI